MLKKNIVGLRGCDRCVLWKMQRLSMVNAILTTALFEFESVCLFDCDRLGEVSRLVDVVASFFGKIVGNQLHRQHV